ncbi:Uncharacterised protein [Actinomyces howellii]|uniref:Uncharacterized protein n=1 Tax=Actinomyces howellii TaxID=52771 RepID=A0A448HJ90_9ACTO|nr:Uncharacterised protein [Actinomyces howellii]
MTELQKMQSSSLISFQVVRSPVANAYGYRLRK